MAVAMFYISGMFGLFFVAGLLAWIADQFI